MVVLIEGTSKPILPRHPYMFLLLVKFRVFQCVSVAKIFR